MTCCLINFFGMNIFRVGVSATGSGKTLAFLLPAMIHINAQVSATSRSLVQSHLLPFSRVVSSRMRSFLEQCIEAPFINDGSLEQCIEARPSSRDMSLIATLLLPYAFPACCSLHTSIVYVTVCACMCGGRGVADNSNYESWQQAGSVGRCLTLSFLPPLLLQTHSLI